jgi:hypothetical protein
MGWWASYFWRCPHPCRHTIPPRPACRPRAEGLLHGPNGSQSCKKSRSAVAVWPTRQLDPLLPSMSEGSRECFGLSHIAQQQPADGHYGLRPFQAGGREPGPFEVVTYSCPVSGAPGRLAKGKLRSTAAVGNHSERTSPCCRSVFQSGQTSIGHVDQRQPGSQSRADASGVPISLSASRHGAGQRPAYSRAAPSMRDCRPTAVQRSIGSRR